jgi:hypothetical protein
MIHFLVYSTGDDSVYYIGCGVAQIYTGLAVILIVHDSSSRKHAFQLEFLNDVNQVVRFWVRASCGFPALVLVV